MTEYILLAANLLVHLDLRHFGDVMGSALRGALMRVASFWIRHYFFSRCRVYFRSLGLYFISSKRSVVLRLFFVVV